MDSLKNINAGDQVVRINLGRYTILTVTRATKTQITTGGFEAFSETKWLRSNGRRVGETRSYGGAYLIGYDDNAKAMMARSKAEDERRDKLKQVSEIAFRAFTDADLDAVLAIAQSVQVRRAAEREAEEQREAAKRAERCRLYPALYGPAPDAPQGNTEPPADEVMDYDDEPECAAESLCRKCHENPAEAHGFCNPCCEFDGEAA